MSVELVYYDFGEKETEENCVLYSDEIPEEEAFYDEERSLSRSTSNPALSGTSTIKRSANVMGFLFGTVRKGSQPIKPEERLPNLDVKLLEAKGLPEMTEPWVSFTVIRKKVIPLDVKYNTNKSGIGISSSIPQSAMLNSPTTPRSLPRSMSRKKTVTSLLKSTDFYWNEYDAPLQFYIHEPLTEILRIELWNTVGQKQSKIVEVDLPLDGLIDYTASTDRWIDLQGSGSIHVNIYYLPECRSKLRACTLERAIAKLTPPSKKERDTGLIINFLLSYRIYMEPSDLLNYLKLRYKDPANGKPSSEFPEAIIFQRTTKGIQDSIAYFVVLWVQYTHDFKGNTIFAEKVYKETKDWCSEIGSEHATPILKSLKKWESTFGEVVEKKESTKTSANSSSGVSEFVVNMDSISVADQLTLLEFNMQKMISASEFMKQAWTKNHVKAPNIRSYIEWFNKVSNWVSTEVIKGKTCEERANVIAKFIEVGMRLHANNNFNGVMEILSSLHCSSISRLSKSWALITPDAKDNFEKLTLLMGPQDNFKVYREAFRDVKGGACCPYLGLWLTDLTFVDEGNEDFLFQSLLNFDKVHIVAKRIKDFQACTYTGYPYVLKSSLRDAVVNAEVWDENDLYRLSRLREDKREQGPATNFDSKSFEKITNSMLNGANVSTENIHLSHRDWQLLNSFANVITFAKDRTILEEGTTNNIFYRIKQGTVRIEKLLMQENGEMKKVVVDQMTVDQYFGEMSIMGDEVGVVSASVVADTSVFLYAIERNFISKLFEKEAGLCMRFYFVVAQKLAKLLVSLSSKNSSTEKAVETKKEVVAEKGAESNSTEDDTILASRFGVDEIVVRTFNTMVRKGVPVYGRMYLSQKHLCFYGKNLGIAQLTKILLVEVEKVKVKHEKNLLIELENKTKHTFYFKSTEEVIECIEMLTQIWKRRSVAIITSTGSTPNIPPAASRKPSEPRDFYQQAYSVLTQLDWDMILKGAKTITVPKDSVIVTQGEKYQRIYQINRGQCRIEVEKEGQKVILGRMHQDETFGEVSFLLQESGASASVIADSTDGVDITIVEGYFVNALFSVHLEFAGRFFKYLAAVLSVRIKDRRR